MSSKNSRHTSPSSSAVHHGPKLPKFLHKPSSRDRSKSGTDPISGQDGDSPTSTSSEPAPIPSSSKHSHHSRKSGKFLGSGKEREREKEPVPEMPLAVEREETPVIVEPVNIPRSRTRSDRPGSSDMQYNGASLYAPSSPSSSRMSDLPTRLSGWFAHTFNSSSTTDLSLPTILSHHSTPNAGAPGTSPQNKVSGTAALLNAAKHGKGHIDKAMRYLLDSDATPDKCTDVIWLLGVQHPGYEPPPPSAYPAPSAGGRRSSVDSRRHSPSFRSSTSSTSSLDVSLNAPQPAKHPGANWPPVFYADFTSRVWLTYRSHFTPIRDGRLGDLSAEYNSYQSDSSTSSPTATVKKWNWGSMVGGEKGWTSDSGWGCMLRTGQSLLANALVHLHLGRDWRRPPHPVYTADYATYVQIVTWFLDTPSPEAPFSVHRMALAGKELGKDVGQWFGPSTAAGAIKALVRAFPESGLGVSVATDGVLFQSDVFQASYSSRQRYHHGKVPAQWGDRPVLLLLGIRLGLDGVNPIYYDTIKLLYTFPQSVGIAGGRPSSSYYFVGSQADNLFYLDPHHARPTVPLRLPAEVGSPDNEPDHRRRTKRGSSSTASSTGHQRAPTSPSSSIRTGSSTFSYHAPTSPSPLQHQFSESGSSSSSSNQILSPSEMDQSENTTEGNLDRLQEHFVNAYSAAELKTFHCERVRKMPLSGLDPSMLIGFLCRDEADWIDFRRRVGDLPRTIFSVQDEPPTWPADSDDNMGLESISDPDDLDMDMEEEGDDEDRELDARSASTSSAHLSSASTSRTKSSELDTEEDPVDPITPGPGSKFEFPDPPGSNKPHHRPKAEEGGVFFEALDDMEDDDEWVDPVLTPTAVPPPPPPKKKKGKKKQVPVPVPMVNFPSAPGGEDGGRGDVSHERQRRQSMGLSLKMNNSRGRDGGRTQSGGVKGVLTGD